MTGLIHAILLDGKGGGRELQWEEALSLVPNNEEVLWIHLDYTISEAVEWITHESKINALAAQALLDENTRPRADIYPGGLLLALRGVNLNPGEDPEDMVAIRLWLETNRVISTRNRPLLTIREIRSSLLDNKGPKTTGDVISSLSKRLLNRMSGAIDQVEDQIIELEEMMLEGSTIILRDQLSRLRRKLIALKRYLAPQREALDALQEIPSDILTDTHIMELRESRERLHRYIEEINEARERASVLHEEIINSATDVMNQRMYVLSLVTAIFLPLGFLTGLLGVNVGGIPGSDNPMAFWVFLGALITGTAVILWAFKIKSWL